MISYIISFHKGFPYKCSLRVFSPCSLQLSNLESYLVFIILTLSIVPIVGFCNCSMFCCALLCVFSSFAIILMDKRDLVALLCLFSRVLCLGWSAVCDCGISDHTHLLLFFFFFCYWLNRELFFIIGGGGGHNPV